MSTSTFSLVFTQKIKRVDIASLVLIGKQIY